MLRAALQVTASQSGFSTGLSPIPTDSKAARSQLMNSTRIFTKVAGWTSLWVASKHDSCCAAESSPGLSIEMTAITSMSHGQMEFTQPCASATAGQHTLFCSEIRTKAPVTRAEHLWTSPPAQPKTLTLSAWRTRPILETSYSDHSISLICQARPSTSSRRSTAAAVGRSDA